MYDYAKEVADWRQKPMGDFPRVTVTGEQGTKYGYTFAKGMIGYAVEERIMSDQTPAYKVFTGTRIWIIPQSDCELHEEQKN